MREITTSGVIRVRDKLGFACHLARIDFTEREDGTFEYVFTPRYAVIDMLSTDVFQGIPGLDLGTRKLRYVRQNMTPTFIEERTPSRRRENLQELLDACDMTYLNRLEWLIRTNMRYSGDLLYVERWQPSDEKHMASMDDALAKAVRSAQATSALLKEICQGNDISTSTFAIDDTNRSTCYHLLSTLLGKEKSYLARQRKEGIAEADRAGHRRGRKRAEVSLANLDAARHAYRSGLATADEAAASLGISRTTFFRRLKELEA